jgi:tartrate-resistant acid phosphatase type 5
MRAVMEPSAKEPAKRRPSTSAGVLMGVAVVMVLSLGCGDDDGPPTTDDPVADGFVTTPDLGPPDLGPPDLGVDMGPPPPEPVRFFVLGDTGEGNDAQRAVAAVMKSLCESEGCDFAVLLGDNIYDAGVDGVGDSQWQSKFEEPYAELSIPFFAVMGNHDYGGSLLGIDTGGLGNEWDKGPVAVQYSAHSDKWVMDDTHYTFTWGNVGFIMIDTNSILWDEDVHGDQRVWYPTALMEVEEADWVFAAMHHPLRSQGKHGNAGRYESIEVGGEEIPLPVPIMDGRNVKSFMEDTVCGTVDIAFAGHDHNRQWLDEADRCSGTELVVSGAGAKTTDFVDARGNDLFWGDDTKPGVLYVVALGNTLTGQFYDLEGTMEFERTLVH